MLKCESAPGEARKALNFRILNSDFRFNAKIAERILMLKAIFEK